MVTRITEGIYGIEIPLPITVVGSMNCYVLADRERPLIIDPGMADDMCLEALRSGLAEIGIDPEKSDYFMTHHHLDHFGLISQVMGDKSTIYINRAEARFIEEIASWSIIPDTIRFLEALDFPEKDPMKVIHEMLGDEYRARSPWPFRYVEEDDIIDKAGHRFRCIVTAGHSIAHTCLYEPDDKILISGDEISPVVTFISLEADLLGNHLRSLDLLRQMDVNLVLPGHRSTIENCKETIDQLKRHHREKAEIIRAALSKNRDSSVYEVARLLHHDSLGVQSWESLPLVLQFIETRDCFAYMRHFQATDAPVRNPEATSS